MKDKPKPEENLKIKAIRNGIVIDHICHGRALEVLRILGIGEDYTDEVTLAMNIGSKKHGRKDIVKVENRDIQTDEINKIAVIAPGATINRVRDFKVFEKEQVALPNEIIGIIKCTNPACISNKDREPLKSFFYVTCREPLTLSCKYCEREVRGLNFED